MIRIQSLYKQFGKTRVLNGLTVDLEPGRAYAVVGPNGSGKTTLIKILLGLVLPDTGEVDVLGQSIRGQWQYRERIGYMPQAARFPEHMRVQQLLDMMSELRPAVVPDKELIDAFGIASFADKPIYALSGGMRQKVSAALAFLFNPDILILDEPTSGLDPGAVDLIKEKINRVRDQQKLVLVTSHVMSDLDELASHLLCLAGGKIIYKGSIADAKWVTGEEKLGRAIAHIMAGVPEIVQ